MSRRRRVEPGDGASPKRYRLVDILNRSVLGITHAGHTYVVDYDFFDWDGKVSLYRDKRRVARSKLPAEFAVAGGRIEFGATFYGVKRAHLVLDDGRELPLSPHPRSPEAWRQRLARRRPRLSAALAVAAVVALVVGLVVGVLAVTETITHLPGVRQLLGWSFDSPIELSGAGASAVTIAGVLAIVERALSMRHHWLLDADTWWMD